MVKLRIGLGLLVASLIGCKDYSLMNGYRFVNFGGSQGVILGPGGDIVVRENVNQCGMTGSLIVGLATHTIDRFTKGDDPIREVDGFFIVDTASGKVEDDLSREEWIERLRMRGLATAPEISYLNCRGVLGIFG